MSKSDYHVGQTVYVVNWRGSSRTREFMISKIGRKWITTFDGWDTMRFDPETGLIDGGKYTSPGKIWKSTEDYKTHVKIVERWNYFCLKASRSHYAHPKGITVERIDELMKELWGEGE